MRRLKSAWRFGSGQKDVRYLVTGGVGASGYPEWKAMQRVLMEAGAAPEQIMIEPEGVDTLQQVRRCVAILRSQNLTDDVWFSTSLYHQPRCWLLFRVFGLKTRAVRALPDRPDLPMKKLLLFWAREVAAIHVDLVLAVAAKTFSSDDA